MALPKRKTSKARKGNRHSHTRVTVATVGLCPHCRSPKASHRVCPTCGYYRGREVISVGQGEGSASS